jgi:hypothetical protein
MMETAAKWNGLLRSPKNSKMFIMPQKKNIFPLNFENDQFC